MPNAQERAQRNYELRSNSRILDQSNWNCLSSISPLSAEDWESLPTKYKNSTLSCILSCKISLSLIFLSKKTDIAIKDDAETCSIETLAFPWASPKE